MRGLRFLLCDERADAYGSRLSYGVHVDQQGVVKHEVEYLGVHMLGVAKFDRVDFCVVCDILLLTGEAFALRTYSEGCLSTLGVCVTVTPCV